MPKVSIIIPAYNAESVIERCVESVLKQDFSDFELLVMDDGSTDRTAEICDRYAETDNRVRAVHKKNSGVSDTRNAAIGMASGEYIQFLDADDWIVPEATELLVHAMEEHRPDLVVSDFYRVVNHHTSRKGSIDTEGMLTREQFADWMSKSPADFYYGVLWNKLFRRDIIEKYQLKMDTTLRWCEDFIFNMEYILHIQNIYILRVPIYYYVKTEGSLVSQGMKIGSIVRMKLNVIEYYSTFFKNVFQGEAYEARRSEVYRFLLDFSHDDFAIPITPGTKRLGKERSITLHEELPESFWSCSYYERRMEEREFHTASRRFGLDYHAFRILAYLHHFDRVGQMDELAAYVGTNTVTVRALIEYLDMKSLITLKNGLPASAVLSENAGDICRALDETEDRIKSMLTDGLSEEECAQYQAFRKQSLKNLQEKLRR